MTEEFIYERERELLDYFRNNTDDPEERGIDVTEEEHIISEDDQESITLNHNLVKNVADTIEINGLNYKKGKYYKVEYGIGNAETKIIFKNLTIENEDVVKVTYHYGQSLVEREFSRTDVTLPRVVMKFLLGTEEFSGLGEIMEDGIGSDFNATYRFEIRDKYADRAREIVAKTFNLARKLRHANLYKLIISSATDLQNFDYDPEKECYIWQFSLNVIWAIPFE